MVCFDWLSPWVMMLGLAASVIRSNIALVCIFGHVPCLKNKSKCFTLLHVEQWIFRNYCNYIAHFALARQVSRYRVHVSQYLSIAMRMYEDVP